MKRPSPATRILGHPVLSGLLLAGGMAFCALCLFHGTQGVLPAIIVGVLLNRVMKAQESERDYRAWKSAWDAMGPHASPPRRPWMLMARTVAVLAGATYALSNISDPQVQVSLGFIFAALLLWAVVAMARRFGGTLRRRRVQAVTPVTIVLRHPLLPVPSLPQACAALPDYCQQLIRPR